MVLERKKQGGKERRKKERRKGGRVGQECGQSPFYSAPPLPTQQWGEHHLRCCPPFTNLDMVHQVNVVGRINY